MSGLEVLGALAAATQLIQQSLKIVALYKKLRDSPEQIRQHALQIEQLIDITKLVEANGLLQTSLVAATLNQCVTEATELLRLLKHAAPRNGLSKFWKASKALLVVAQERQILDHVAQLDRDVSNVKTTINGVASEIPIIRDNIRKLITLSGNTNALSTISNEMQEMQHSFADMTGNVRTICGELPEIASKVAAIHDDMLPQIHQGIQKLMLRQPIAESAPARVPNLRFVMIPFARNSRFVGRKMQLQELSDKYQGPGTHQRTAIVGLGGAGKTQSALEFSYRRLETDERLSVFWVNASTAERFEQDFLKIGSYAGLEISKLEEHSISPMTATKNWLNSDVSGKWMLVVDNADEMQVFFGSAEARQSKVSQSIVQHLPNSPNGTILMTTRNKKVGVKFATAADTLAMPQMNHEDAEQLFRARSGEIKSSKQEIGLLLDQLEYLPLALSQAGAYISENSMSATAYLKIFKEGEFPRTELLSQDWEDDGRDDPASNPVAKTFCMSFQQIQATDPIAGDTLALMACLDDQHIPRDLLPLPTCNVKSSRALGLLKAFSLITTDETDSHFTMHRLVYLGIRNWLRLHARFNSWAEVALCVVTKRFPTPNSSNLLECDHYLPHAQAVYAYGDYLGKKVMAHAELSKKLSQYFKLRGSFYTATYLAEEAIKSHEKAQSYNNSNWLLAVENLDDVIRAQEIANLEEYQPLLPRWEKWYTQWEKHGGPNNSRLRLCTMNLIASLKAHGETEAIAEIRRRRRAALRQSQDPINNCNGSNEVQQSRNNENEFRMGIQTAPDNVEEPSSSHTNGESHQYRSETKKRKLDEEQLSLSAENSVPCHPLDQADETRYHQTCIEGWEKHLEPDSELRRRAIANKKSALSRLSNVSLELKSSPPVIDGQNPRDKEKDVGARNNYSRPHHDLISDAEANWESASFAEEHVVKDSCPSAGILDHVDREKHVEGWKKHLGSNHGLHHHSQRNSMRGFRY